MPCGFKHLTLFIRSTLIMPKPCQKRISFRILLSSGTFFQKRHVIKCQYVGFKINTTCKIWHPVSIYPQPLSPSNAVSWATNGRFMRKKQPFVAQETDFIVSNNLMRIITAAGLCVMQSVTADMDKRDNYSLQHCTGTHHIACTTKRFFFHFKSKNIAFGRYGDFFVFGTCTHHLVK